MQALLVLYMVGELLRPGRIEQVIGFETYRGALQTITGPLSVTALATQTFGLYVGLVYCAPIVGGMIGDRFIGRRVAVMGGAALMIAGHLALSLDRLFLLALLLLVAGAGLMRSNLSAQLKSLYATGDPRGIDAFQIYYAAINVGAFLAPLLTGGLAALYGWHVGFASAAVGMMIGLAVYVAGSRHLPPDEPRGLAALPPLDAGDRARLLALLALWLPIACLWVGQSQIWNAYNLWVRDHLDLAVGGGHVPIVWLQALNGLVPVVFMPAVLAFWRRQALSGREPHSATKLAIGCLIVSLGFVWLAMAPTGAASDNRVPLAWAVAFHVIVGIGYLYTTPVATALFASKSPARLRGTMLGVANLTVFLGSTISGRLGALYERLTPGAFWMLHACVVLAGAVALLLARGWLRRSLEAGDAPG